MAIEVKVPSVGESVTEGRIARWMKKDGEAVKLDEPLFELESDKAAQEIVAPAAGILKTLFPEGEIVQDWPGWWRPSIRAAGRVLQRLPKLPPPSPRLFLFKNRN